jgi:hypothetical protein
MDYVLAGKDAPPMVSQLMELVKKWHESDPDILALRERLLVVAAQLFEGPTAQARTGDTRLDVL